MPNPRKDPRSITGVSYGVSEEGRLITGMEGYDGVDTDLDIPTESGGKKPLPSFETNLKRDASGQIVNTSKPLNRYCPNGQHELVPDESEGDFEAVQCTRCPYHCLVKPKIAQEQS